MRGFRALVAVVAVKKMKVLLSCIHKEREEKKTPVNDQTNIKVNDDIN